MGLAVFNWGFKWRENLEETGNTVPGIEDRASVVPIQFRVAMDVRLVAGNRGGRVLVINGSRYHKHRNANETIHWRCWRKECNARVRTNRFNIEDLEDANEIHVLFHEEHNHETDDKMIDRAVLRETMRGEVLDNPARPIKQARIQGGGQGGLAPPTKNCPPK